jgi:hypothetical protein
LTVRRCACWLLSCSASAPTGTLEYLAYIEDFPAFVIAFDADHNLFKDAPDWSQALFAEFAHCIASRGSWRGLRIRSDGGYRLATRTAGSADGSVQAAILQRIAVLGFADLSPQAREAGATPNRERLSDRSHSPHGSRPRQQYHEAFAILLLAACYIEALPGNPACRR